MILRPYQDKAIRWLRRAVKEGARAPLLVCPTGGGKTAMGAHVAAGHVAKGGRVLWLAHRRELVHQAAGTLERVGLEVGHAGLKASAPVQVASVQTLLARGEAPAASLVVYDEAHHFAADDWGRLAKAYGTSIRIGLTATPERGDGKGLGDIFDRLIVVAQIKELVDLGALVPCDVYRPSSLLKAGSIVQAPVDAYEGKGGGHALVFAPNTKAAKEYVEDFRKRGHSAAMVEASTPDDERDSAIDGFRTGRVKVLVNVMVLTEGFDATIADTCILARGCGSAGLYLQMVGRVLRAHPGKTRAKLLDLRGISHLLGEPDEERIYSLDGRGIGRASNAAAERFCRVCGAVLDSTPGTPCEQCGTQAKPLEVPTVTGGALEKFAAMRALPDDKRVAWLSKQIGVMRSKGYKEGWLRFRYKSVFGYMPPADVWARAHQEAKGS